MYTATKQIRISRNLEYTLNFSERTPTPLVATFLSNHRLFRKNLAKLGADAPRFDGFRVEVLDPRFQSNGIQILYSMLETSTYQKFFNFFTSQILVMSLMTLSFWRMRVKLVDPR